MKWLETYCAGEQCWREVWGTAGCSSRGEGQEGRTAGGEGGQGWGTEEGDWRSQTGRYYIYSVWSVGMGLFSVLHTDGYLSSFAIKKSPQDWI